MRGHTRPKAEGHFDFPTFDREGGIFADSPVTNCTEEDTDFEGNFVEIKGVDYVAKGATSIEQTEEYKQFEADGKRGG